MVEEPSGGKMEVSMKEHFLKAGCMARVLSRTQRAADTKEPLLRIGNRGMAGNRLRKDSTLVNRV